MKLNCGGFTETLAESELFGHVKGAFTGAHIDKQGILEKVNGGILFLDEIGDLPLSIQVKLLRVLVVGKFNKVGSTKVIETKFRLLSATNQDLEKMVEEKRFRSDLLYRINAVTINLPSLKSRREDIAELVSYFLKKEMKNGKRIKVNEDFYKPLKIYHWPGNIRELKNVIKNVLLMNDNDKELCYFHLPKAIYSAFTIFNEVLSDIYLNFHWSNMISSLYRYNRLIDYLLDENVDEIESNQDIKTDTVVDIFKELAKNISDNNEINEGPITAQEPTDTQTEIEKPLPQIPFNEDGKEISLKEKKTNTEKKELEELAERYHYNIKKIAEIYGQSPPTVYRKLKKYGIPTKPKFED